jgi:enoyl-[acyl-carrier protein] reductase II
VHPEHEAAALAAGIDGTRTVGRGLGMIRAVANGFTDRMTALEEAGVDVDERREIFQGATSRDAALHGDVRGGKVEAGQTAGLLHEGLLRDLRPTAELVARIRAEYEAAAARLIGAAAG